MPSSFLPADGAIERTSNDALLALAWAWEKKSQQISSGDQQPSQALENARAYYEAAFERDLRGSANYLIGFFRRNGLRTEALGVCEQMVERGRPEFLLDAASMTKGSDELAYLRRAYGMGLDVELNLALTLAEDAHWRLNDEEAVEVRTLLDSHVQKKEKGFYRVRLTLNGNGGAASSIFDGAASEYVDAIANAATIYKGLGDSEALLPLQRKQVVLLTGPALGTWQPEDPLHAGPSDVTMERAYLAEEWAMGLAERFGPREAMTRMDLDIKELGCTGLLLGKARLYEEEFLDLGEPELLDRMATTYRQAATAGVPGASEIHRDKLAEIAVDTEWDDVRELVHDQLLEAGTMAAEAGEPRQLVMLAHYFARSKEHGRARQAIDHAVAYAETGTPIDFEEQATFALVEMKAKGAGPEELLTKCDEFVQTAALVDPNIGGGLYLTVAERMFMGSSSPVAAQFLKKSAHGAIELAKTGRAEGLWQCQASLNLLAGGRSDSHAQTFREVATKFAEVATGIAEQHPQLTSELQEICDECVTHIEESPYRSGFDVSRGESSRPDVGLQHFRVLRSEIASAAYQANPGDFNAIDSHILDLSRRNQHEEVITAVEDVIKSATPLSQTASDCYREAVRLTGNEELFDALWMSSIAKLPKAGTAAERDMVHSLDFSEPPEVVKRWARGLQQRDLPSPWRDRDLQKTTPHTATPERNPVTPEPQFRPYRGLEGGGIGL